MKTLIVNGDSWMFGSEILNPKIKPKMGDAITEIDFLKENDGYRLPKIFSTHLGNLMKYKPINLSWPADDNKSILLRTISYITEEYISKGKSTDDIFVVIGWTSPERNSFWWNDEESNYSEKFILWPHVRHFADKIQEMFWKLYVTYMWTPEEYVPRYIMDNVTFQNFCNSHSIKYLVFNAFATHDYIKKYPINDKNITNTELEDFQPLQYITNLRGDYHWGGYDEQTIEDNITTRQNHSIEWWKVWETVDKKRYYKKNEAFNSMRSFINKLDTNEKKYNNIHPSPYSHEMFAKEIFNYIKENKLL